MKELLATFKFTGDSHSDSAYEIITLDFSFNQSYDQTKRPSSQPTLSLINITIKGNNGVEFFDWMIRNDVEKECTIELTLSESEKRTIEIKEALCVSYNEHFDNYSDSPLLFSIGIMARILRINDMEYLDWSLHT